MKVLIFQNATYYEEKFSPIMKTLVETRKDLFEKKSWKDIPKDELEEEVAYMEEFENYYVDGFWGMNRFGLIEKESLDAYYLKDTKTFRTDPKVIELFEDLGYNQDDCFDIVEVPDDMKWRIVGDGWIDECEAVVEDHRVFNFDYRRK